MIDSLMDFLNTPVRPGAVVAIRLAIWVPVVYLIIQFVRALSAAGRWKLVKLFYLLNSVPNLPHRVLRLAALSCATQHDARGGSLVPNGEQTSHQARRTPNHRRRAPGSENRRPGDPGTFTSRPQHEAMGWRHAAPQAGDRGQQRDLVPLLAGPGRTTPADLDANMVQACQALEVVGPLKLEQRCLRQPENSEPLIDVGQFVSHAEAHQVDLQPFEMQLPYKLDQQPAEFRS